MAYPSHSSAQQLHVVTQILRQNFSQGLVFSKKWQAREGLLGQARSLRMNLAVHNFFGREAEVNAIAIEIRQGSLWIHGC